MTHTQQSSPQIARPESLLDRRETLRASAASLAALFSAATLPQASRAEEVASLRSVHRLRDLGKSYSLWEKSAPPGSLPSFPTFERAIEACRSAACGIHHRSNGVGVGCHSGFLVTIPKENLTARGRANSYIVTCDHARSFDIKNSTIQIILSNGRTIHPRGELMEAIQPNGFPSKDLRVLECDPKDTAGLAGLPLREISEPVAAQAPVIIYEPLGARVSTQFDSATGKIRPVVFRDDVPPLERFVLTSVSDPSNPKEKDPNYPANTGFMTHGQLHTGGSGSPAVLFQGDTFTVGGYQVGYIPNPQSEDSVDGELQCDGHLIHANNIISLLKRYRAWK